MEEEIQENIFLKGARILRVDETESTKIKKFNVVINSLHSII